MKKVLAFLTLLVCVAAKAQTVATVTMPMNKYVHTSGCCSQPTVNMTEVNALVKRATYINVSDYTAANDAGNDLNGIQSCLNAAVASTKKLIGIRFVANGSYVLGTTNSTNSNQKKTVNFANGDTLIIDLNGATLKAANLSRYSWLEIDNSGATGAVIVINGNLDGNQYNQVWPGNSHGGQYNASFVEDHGRFLGFKGWNFALATGVDLQNIVVDGIGMEDCNMAVFNDGVATGGAPFHFNDEGVAGTGVGEQGTYYKSISVGTLASYYLNLICIGGSIGTHVSTRTDEQPLLVATAVAYHYNCYYKNQAQDAAHIEDCRNAVFRRCTFESDNTAPAGMHNYLQRIWCTNQTATVTIDRCNFKNAWVEMNLGANLILAIVRLSNFTSTYNTGYINHFVSSAGQKGPLNIIASTFTGRVGSEAVQADYVKGSTFTNTVASVAIRGSNSTDSNTFVNAVKATSTTSGNYHNTYVNTSGSNSTPSGNWFNVFLNRIDLYKKEETAASQFLSYVISKL